MAFTPVNDGDLAVAPQLQQIIDALQGVAGAGQPISLTSLDSDDAYALTVQNLGSGGALLVLDENGDPLLDITGSGVSFSGFELAAGTVSAPSLHGTGSSANTGVYFPAADQFAVTVDGTQRGNFTSTGLNVTGQLASVSTSNSTYAVSAQGTHATDSKAIQVKSQDGLSNVLTVGYDTSKPALRFNTDGGTHVVLGSIGGTNNAILVRDGSNNGLFGVSPTGTVTVRHIIPLADSTYNLGDGTTNFQVVCSDFYSATADGTPSAANFNKYGVGTTGLYMTSAGAAVGLTLGASNYVELSSAGLQVEKSAIIKEVAATPSAPSSGYQQIYASTAAVGLDALLYRQRSGGTNYAIGTHTRTMLREEFIGRILAITGDTRLFWLPASTDTTTSIDQSLNGRTLTHDATIAARLAALGLGYSVSFNGSSQYATTPDAVDLSFGNGGTDSAFSIVALANVTDTANVRMFCSKDNTSNREYALYLDASDKLTAFMRDESATANTFRISDAVVTMGALTLYAMSYAGASGGGLTTNQNGTILYQNGLAIASTATNSGSYGGMDNGTAAFEIGSFTAHTSGFMQGTMALLLVCQKQLSASEMWAIKKLVNAFFNLSL